MFRYIIDMLIKKILFRRNLEFITIWNNLPQSIIECMTMSNLCWQNHVLFLETQIWNLITREFCNGFVSQMMYGLVGQGGDISISHEDIVHANQV